MATHAVTGAFGFSGKYLTKLLLDKGEKVLTLTNSPNRPHPFGDKIKAFPFQFDNIDAMATSLTGVDVLYNTYWVRFNQAGMFSHSSAVRHTEALFTAAKIAKVRRVVHISITNPDESSNLEYFQGKGYLERTLKESGLSYTILRPAVLFGPEDILINNIAWILRKLPVFAMFGDGSYHMQPIYVEDLAKLMLEQGMGSENTILNALGPEDYTYKDLVAMISKELGLKRWIVGIPPELGYLASLAIGKLMGDVFVTREEIAGLMADTLHVPGAAPTGKTLLSAWVRENKDTLGKKYHGELPRRINRDKAY